MLRAAPELLPAAVEELFRATRNYELTGPPVRRYTQAERTIASLPATIDWA